MHHNQALELISCYARKTSVPTLCAWNEEGGRENAIPSSGSSWSSELDRFLRFNQDEEMGCLLDSIDRGPILVQPAYDGRPERIDAAVQHIRHP